MTSPVAPSRATRDAEFTAFVREHRASLMRVACLLAGNRAAGEDVLQDALLKVYLAWPRIDERGAYGYTRRVLANAATDAWRRHRREYPTDDPRPDSAQPGSYLTEVEERDDIVARLAGLDAKERLVVVLRFCEDLSEKQVAAETGLPLGTVKSTTARALAKLRRPNQPGDQAPSSQEIPR